MRFFFFNFETTHHLGLPTGQTQIGIVGIPTWLFLVFSPRDSTQIILSKPLRLNPEEKGTIRN